MTKQQKVAKAKAAYYKIDKAFDEAIEKFGARRGKASRKLFSLGYELVYPSNKPTFVRRKAA